MTPSRSIAAILMISFVFEISGCATAIFGRDEEVSFASDPSDAIVTIDGTQFGRTPTTAKLTRADPHSIRIEKPGYVTYETRTTSARNPKKFLLDAPGALAFPPLALIMLVDNWLGGNDEIQPTEVSAHLLAAPANPTTVDTDTTPLARTP